jgi:hypothetical protein
VVAENGATAKVVELDEGLTPGRDTEAAA